MKLHKKYQLGMPFCAFGTCRNRSHCRKRSVYYKGISFHKFPADPVIKKIWIEATGRIQWTPSKHSTICSKHFEENDFVTKYSKNRYLKPEACPIKTSTITPVSSPEPERSGTSGNGDTSPQREAAVVHAAETTVENTNTVPEETPEVIKVFCPKCKSEVSHTAEGIQMDQKDQLIAKVYHYFEQEYEELKRTIPGIEQSALAQLRQRTARATGVSETAVADVLAEEARRNEVRVKEEKRRSKEPLLVERKTRIRSMQDESSGEECNYYSSDEDNDDRFEATETLVIKEEPLEPEYEEPAEPAFLNLPSVKLEPGSSEDPKELVDPIAINIKKEPGVKTEPNEEEATTSNGTTGATTSIKKRKIKTETPPATSSSPTTSSPPKRRLMQIKDIKVKVEKEEIKEEGNS